MEYERFALSGFSSLDGLIHHLQRLFVAAVPENFETSSRMARGS